MLPIVPLALALRCSSVAYASPSKMSATASAIRVVAPVARVAARKATAPRAAAAVKVRSLRFE